MAIPTRVADRLSAGLKKYQPVLTGAKSRDVNESDTSMIVTDLLAEVFGYDKYSEVTRELCIRGTYCDLATRIDGKFQMLIEVKAIGLDLKAMHVKQAVDYAANQGIEWVALTSGSIWRVFRVIFAKPIGTELVLDIDLLTLSPKNSAHLESLFLLTRESMLKSGLTAFHDQAQATNKFYLGALVLSDPVLETVRRELQGLLADLVGGTASLLLGYEGASTLPLDAPPPLISWASDEVYVFTGRFAYGPRRACELAVVEHGARCEDAITRRTSFMVVGTFGSLDWAHSSYGRKIQRVVDLRASGLPVRIVGEDHWASALSI